jgi:cystathionine gamma-synthase
VHDPDDERGPLTDAVHGGEPRTNPYHALATPVIQTATYTFERTDDLIGFMNGTVERLDYGRYGNPTVRVLEERVAFLEGAEDAAAFASGMNALVTTILTLVKSGSHIVLSGDCYRRTRRFVTKFLSRFGVTHTVVPPGNVAAMEQALRPETRLVLAELPTNPFLAVLDLPAVTAFCQPRGIKVIVDSTFATPVNLRPIAHGADLVVHSATKYLSGHNDVLCGVVAGSSALVSVVRESRHELGGILDPHAGFLVLRGMKTLALRVRQQNASAAKLAAALEAHPRVRRVWYPGLASHPDHALATKLMTGFGGVVTFEVEGDQEAATRVVDGCRIPRIAPSLGGVESLIEQPALMSYFDVDPADRDALGIRTSLIRYGVGVEDADDLCADLLRALERAYQ